MSTTVNLKSGTVKGSKPDSIPKPWSKPNRTPILYRPTCKLMGCQLLLRMSSSTLPSKAFQKLTTSHLEDLLNIWGWETTVSFIATKEVNQPWGAALIVRHFHLNTFFCWISQGGHGGLGPQTTQKKILWYLCLTYNGWSMKYLVWFESSTK